MDAENLEVCQEPVVYALIERLRIKFLQLNHAIAGGNDELVDVIDRDIEQSLATLMEARPASVKEAYAQIRYVGEMIHNLADDPGCVRRNAGSLIALLDRLYRKSAERPEPRILRKLPSASRAADDINLYQAMLDALPEPVVLVGSDLCIIYANAAFCSSHGRKVMQCIGVHFREFASGDGMSLDLDVRLREYFAGLLSGREPAIPAADALQSANLRPLRLGDGICIGVMIVFRQPVSRLLHLQS